jgi:outer membrane immunogenic protein
VTASDLNNTEWQWFVGARAGVLLTPKTLGYALVGYTETIDGQLAFKSIATTQFKDIAGFTYGGGVEQLLAQGWSIKAEYRYVQFGDETAPNGVKDGLKDGTDVESGAHQVRFGVLKRF